MKESATLAIKYKLEGVPYENEMLIKAKQVLPPKNRECIDGNVWCCIFELQSHEFSRDELYYHKDAAAAAQFYLKLKVAELAKAGYKLKVKDINFIETQSR